MFQIPYEIFEFGDEVSKKISEYEESVLYSGTVLGARRVFREETV